jgi:outer membrane lipoprotein-sorting protein
MKIIINICAFLLFASTLFASDIGEKIAEKNIKERGGKSKIEAVKQWKFTMVSTDIQANKKDNGIMYFDESNGAFYVEQSLNGEMGIFAWDGEKGWFVAPFLNVKIPTQMDDMTRMGTDAQFKQVLGLVRGIFYDYKQDSTKVVFVEKLKIENKFYNKVKLTQPHAQINVEILVGVDNSFVHKIMLFDINSGGDGNNQAMTEIKFSGHKEYSGIIFPTSIETTMNEQKVSLIKFTDIELNKKLDKSKFMMPEARPPIQKSSK